MHRKNNTDINLVSEKASAAQTLAENSVFMHDAIVQRKLMENSVFRTFKIYPSTTRPSLKTRLLLDDCFFLLNTLSQPNMIWVQFAFSAAYQGPWWSRHPSSNISQLPLGDPDAFPNQIRHKISPGCSGSSPGSPTSWVCPENLQRKASRRILIKW